VSDSCNYSLGSIWPDDLYFVVPLIGGSYINAGGNIIQLPEKFRKWKVRVVRNNVPQDYGQQVSGDPYWTRDYDTNTIGLSADAIDGEKFQIQAYKPRQ
jgi:hypothetical protein